MLQLLAGALLCAASGLALDASQVVFVHGFAGWGPDELKLGSLQMAYFGQLSGSNYMQDVADEGFTSHYASVGPFSSNHDRACELYAQIKGTVVDYGLAHAAKFTTASLTHNRFGKDYTTNGGSAIHAGGMYPLWSKDNKMHFIGHSMGGNTIRFLEHLLQQGEADEVAADYSGESVPISPLFSGSGRDWMLSVTTVSTPHDGSTLITNFDQINDGGAANCDIAAENCQNPTGIQDLTDLIKSFVVALASINGLFDELYDMDLGHLNAAFSRNTGESFADYAARAVDFLFAQSAQGVTDFASWDLSPEYARDFNRKATWAYPNTYYFAYATERTHYCYVDWGFDYAAQLVFDWFWGVLGGCTGVLPDCQCPDYQADPLFQATGTFMGNMAGKLDLDGFNFDDSKYEINDGAVPLESSKGPQWKNDLATGSPSMTFSRMTGWGNHQLQDSFRSNVSYACGLLWLFTCYESVTTPAKGKWYWKTVQRDHMQVVGLLGNDDGTFSDIGKILQTIRTDTTTGSAGTESRTLGVMTQEGGMAFSVLNIVAIACGVTAFVGIVAFVTVRVVRRKDRNSAAAVDHLNPAEPDFASPRSASRLVRKAVDFEVSPVAGHKMADEESTI